MFRKYDAIMPILIMDKFAVKQSESIRKAMSDQELPPKQKHIDRIVKGTHERKSCAYFWSSIVTGNLEYHPIVTWKFCHVLHSMIRDGHASVPAESNQSLRRLMGLRDFWKSRQSSGYAAASAQYCIVLCDRLLLHRKYPQIPGNLIVPDGLLVSFPNAVVLNAATELLDHVDILLLLQRTVFDSLEWPYVTGQGQTLLAPLTMVISDLSKLYEILVEVLNHLHSVYPATRLAIHRQRFQEIFRQLKAFYDLASKLHYFPTLPTLPTASPTFRISEEIFLASRAEEITLREEPRSLLMQPD